MVVISAPQEVKDCFLGTTQGTRFFLLCTQSSVSCVDEKSLFKICIKNEANVSSCRNLPDGDCIFNQLLPESMDCEVGFGNNVTNVYKLAEKDRVYFSPSSDIISINIYMDLVLLNMRFNNCEKNQYCINVFKIGHAGVEKKLFERLPEQKIKFPLKESRSDDAENRSLLCIITSSNFMSTQSNGNVILPHELYVVMFSKKFELSSSPVVLFCDNYGCVYYVLLKEHCDNGHNPHHVLCEVGSCVVGVHCVQVPHIKNFVREDSSNEIPVYDDDRVENSPALVVISQRGTVFLFMVLNSKKVQFTVHISGPIVCSLNGNFLYHSNGKTIFSTKFYYDEREERVYVKSTVVKDVCITQMEIATNDYQDEHDSLVCRTRTGEMIYVPTFNTTPLTMSRSLKDLLYHVNQDRHTLTKLSRHHRCLNEIIEQMNFSARLLNNYLSPESLQLLVTDIRIQNEIEGAAHRYYLCLKIVNQTKMIISTDWSVVYCFSRGDSLKSICHTHKLTTSWKPKGCVNIRLQVTEDINEVEIFLGFNTVLDAFKLKQIPIDIYIPIAKYELNVLDFLVDENVYNQIEHGNVAFVPKKAEAQIYTAQVLISTIHTQTFTKENKNVRSDDVLKFLVRNHVNSEIQVNNGSVRLRNLSGSIIVLSINLKDDEVGSSEDNDVYIITLHSDHCSLLASVRSAVLRIVQKNLPGVTPYTGSRSQQCINQLKEIKSNLEEILVKIYKFKPEEIFSEICQVYGLLRQVHV